MNSTVDAANMVAQGTDFSLWGLFLEANFVVKLLMLGLLVASVWVWAVVFEKVVSLRKVNREARRADLAEAEGARLTLALEDSEERAAEAIVRVAELEQENEGLESENGALRAELDSHTSWHPEVRPA